MSKNAEYLYRIGRFEYLFDLFDTSELFFARPQSWDDPYESRLEHPSMNDIFGQCWCRDGVSDAMWRIYSPNHTGVRIKVKQSVLSQQLNESKSQIDLLQQRIVDVKYRPQSQIDHKHNRLVEELNAKYDPIKAMSSLRLKRRAFKHEAETRVLLHVVGVDYDQPGVRVPVKPNELVETILADPRMSNPMYEVFSHYLKRKFGFTRRFKKSQIYEFPEPLRAGFGDES